MSSTAMILASDFRHLPRGPYRANRWRAAKQLSTPFGAFEIRAMMSEADADPPDEQMVRELNRVCQFVTDHAELVLDKIYEHYRIYADCESIDIDDLIPRDLDRSQLAPHLKGLSIFIGRGDSEACIAIDAPTWDVEHGLTMVLKSGELEFADA